MATKERSPAIENDLYAAHVTDNEMVRFLDGTLGESERERVRMHLLACERCSEVYEDALVVHGVWMTDESAFEPSVELVAAGARVVPEPVSGGVVSGRTARDVGRVTRGTGMRGYRRLGVVTACAVLALVAGLLSLRLGGPVRTSGDGLGRYDRAIVAPVRQAIETASARGLFVLPGGEGPAGGTSSVYRSGFAPLNDSLAVALDHLRRSFQEGDSSSDLAWLLIGGYVATGQRDAARDLAEHPRMSHPDDWRVTVLKALVAFMDGDLERSESMLRNALERDPENPVARINLALVLNERGDAALARTVLEGVAVEYAGTPIATRAQSILADLLNE
jgi:hypothetical protein